VAAAAVGMTLPACSSPMHAGAAAVVGKERISASQVNENTQVYVTALRNAKLDEQTKAALAGTTLEQAALQGTSASQLVLRVPFTQTTGAVVNDWATHAWFLLAFLYGFVLMADDRLLAAVDDQWRRVLAPALAAMTCLLVWGWPGDVYARIPGEPSLWYAAWWVNFTVACWAWLVVILGAARRHLARPAPSLRRWTEAAYPFYILHQPVLVFVAFHIVDWPMALAPRFAAIALGGLILTIVLLEIVRGIPLLRILFGLPPRARRHRLSDRIDPARSSWDETARPTTTVPSTPYPS
jgi:peptidoglycan/LPS O-acetylase OafA/YrhL